MQTTRAPAGPQRSEATLFDATRRDRVAHIAAEGFRYLLSNLAAGQAMADERYGSEGIVLRVRTNLGRVTSVHHDETRGCSWQLRYDSAEAQHPLWMHGFGRFREFCMRDPSSCMVEWVTLASSLGLIFVGQEVWRGPFHGSDEDAINLANERGGTHMSKFAQFSIMYKEPVCGLVPQDRMCVMWPKTPRAVHWQEATHGGFNGRPEQWGRHFPGGLQEAKILAASLRCSAFVKGVGWAASEQS